MTWTEEGGNIFIAFVDVSLLKWYIIYHDTPNIKEDMNELVSSFRFILLRLAFLLTF